MKERLFIIVLAIAMSMFGFSSIANATDNEPMAIESNTTPADTYLSTNKSSIGASTTHTTISAPTRRISRAVDTEYGWGNPFLPGGDGWETGGTGNVGYPVGDVSLPILLSMLLIYFVYRGVSSTKRRNNF